jgi:hypothetical protein
MLDVPKAPCPFLFEMFRPFFGGAIAFPFSHGTRIAHQLEARVLLSKEIHDDRR